MKISVFGCIKISIQFFDLQISRKPNILKLVKTYDRVNMIRMILRLVYAV